MTPPPRDHACPRVPFHEARRQLTFVCHLLLEPRQHLAASKCSANIYGMNEHVQVGVVCLTALAWLKRGTDTHLSPDSQTEQKSHKCRQLDNSEPASSFHLPEKAGSAQFSSVAQSCPTLCEPTDCSMPGFPVHHQFPEPIQTHVH